MDRYELVKNIGTGNFGVARLMRDRITKELVAIKCIERGARIDQNVQREIINHRSLRHPNIVRFKEVCLTDTHLAIVMEYAAGGELFERISTVGRFKEVEARFFFQQLISGVSYCHAMQICHRDLKLENTLLDGSHPPQLKICDFGYSKSAVLHSAPKSTVGTPAYIAPEVLKGKRYDGKMADVWSCGVTLYVMLVGAYPFEDADDPKNFRKACGRILKAQYTIPSFVEISPECSHLLSLILVANPSKRITIPEIMCHEWFTKDLPRDLALGSDPSYDHDRNEQPAQSIQEVLRILNEARMMPGGSHIPLELMNINNAEEEEDKYDDGDTDAAAAAAADDDDNDAAAAAAADDDQDDADDDEEKDPIPDMIHESDSELEIDAEVEYFDVEECPEFDDPSQMSDHGNLQNGQFHISFSTYFQYYLLVFRWGRNVIWNLSKFL